MEEEWAKYINETHISWNVPSSADYEGVHYSGDLRKRPDILHSLGFYLVQDDPDVEPPEPVSGKHQEERYRFDSEQELIFKRYVLVDDPPRNLSLSKRKLMVNFKELGIWEQVKQFMQTTKDYWDNWDAATTLDEQEEMMQDAIAALKTAFSLSDEVVEQILTSSEAY